MRSKLLSILLACTMIMGSSLTVFAEQNSTEVSVSDIAYNATTDMSVVITAEMLGEDVIVTVPALISFSQYDYEEGDLNSSGDDTIWDCDDVAIKRGVVTAHGVLPANNKLYIGVLHNAKFYWDNDTDSGIFVRGAAYWNPDINAETGTADANGIIAYEKRKAYDYGGSTDVGYIELNADQTRASVAKNVYYALCKDDVNYAGSYYATVNYDIAICEDKDAYEALSLVGA